MESGWERGLRNNRGEDNKEKINKETNAAVVAGGRDGVVIPVCGGYSRRAGFFGIRESASRRGGLWGLLTIVVG